MTDDPQPMAAPARFAAEAHGGPACAAGLRVGIYFSPLGRILKPTGVGRHIVNMAIELGRAEGVEGSLLVDREAYEQYAAQLPAGFDRLWPRLLPGSEFAQRALLLYTRLAGVERWAGELDWVYCPKEQPVTTRKARLAVTVHDMLPFEPDLPGVNGRWHPRSWLRWRVTMRRILRRAHLIATVSEYTRRRMLSLFDVPRPERIVVVGNGVSAAFFRTPQPEDAETLARYELAERPYVVVPGSLTGRKGADRVLQLACRLKREGSDVLLLVVGRRHEPQCLAMFDELQRAEGPLPVRLAGFVPDDDLACLLSHALALFFPSRYEGFGIPALEAMAAGTPVVASRAGALADTVAGAGIFVSGADIDEALAALRELSRCEAARAELIAAGRRRAARFTWPRCAARLIEAMATA